jgi:hypothetical protein
VSRAWPDSLWAATGFGCSIDAVVSLGVNDGEFERHRGTLERRAGQRQISHEGGHIASTAISAAYNWRDCPGMGNHARALTS